MAESYIKRAHKQIQVESWSNSAREILLRGYSEAGPFAESHTTNADRSRATDTYEVHGVPQSISARPRAVPVRRGECYIRITLLVDGEPVKRLMAAYLTDGKTLSWPPGVHEGFTEGPGLIRLVTGTNPAAGVEVLEAVPTNARWKLRGLYIQLTTDANAANRTVLMELDDGTTVFYTIRGPVHTASLTRGYFGVVDPGYLEAAFDAGNAIRLPLPEITLYQGWSFGTTTVALQVGDDWTAPTLIVEEWIEE